MYFQRRRHSATLGHTQWVCGAHSSWRSIVRKAFRHGFYWPTAKDDAMEIVAKCRDCQFFQKQTMKHANPLRPIDISWPFVIWGIDIVGILVVAEKSTDVPQREPSGGHSDQARRARSEVASSFSPNRRLAKNDARRHITQNHNVQEYGRDRDDL
jgi:hypothetical protein